MITWRYHVVSLVAVVLAFGLGILAGTLVVGEDLVRQLRENTNDARRERDAAVAQVARYEQFAAGLRTTLRDDTLLGEEAIVITMDGFEGPAQRTVQELGAAGVEVLAMLELTTTIAEPEAEETAAVLETILDLPDADPEDLREAVAGALAVRLAAGVLADEDDVLGRLLQEGLVTADRDLEPAALLGIGGGGQLIVIAAGGAAPAGFPGPEAILLPITERLVVRLGVATAAVGPTEDPYGYVAAVRGETAIPDCSMVTVDDIDLEAIGGITLVMGIDRLLSDDDPVFRPGGDYGIDGDAMIVPGADEPPRSCRR